MPVPETKTKKAEHRKTKPAIGMIFQKNTAKVPWTWHSIYFPADPGATRVPPSGLRHVSGRGTRRGSAGRGTMATREARGKPYRQRPKGAPEDFENVR